jgi:uncharacterized protein (TIGR02600 family)
LVIVLTFLVVITGLVVAFLSSVTNEATATSASAAAVTTRSLADAAIQLDIAQIRDATVGFSRNADGSLNTASPVAWASQPGAIRTYDTNAAAVAVYKLYSSTNMVATGGQSPTNDLPSSAGWVSSTALYTDLNAPVVSGGNTNYPIMDPYMTNTSNGCTLVDGFSISNAPLLSGISNAAAMPVVWIYVLKDGTLIRPDSVSGTTATFASASTNPSAVNPIVGRIAFWTDDETCKLNLNTASEGSFWGTPSFSTSEDVSFARYPPSSTEYSRFPGHPASTCLSPVLWSYLGLTNPAIFLSGLSGVAGSGSYNAGSGDTAPKFGSTTVTNFFTNLFNNVTPRYGWSNSSQAGTYSLIGTNLPSKLSTNRLYASIDEFYFAPTNASPTSRIVTPIALNARDVSRMRFFLTAESRAPEVNPFNLPKISIWPIPDSNKAHTDPANPTGNKQTLTDQTIAFCSTLGTNAYYFTRYDPTSTNNDFSGRNTNVYNYLRNMFNQPIPGFKGTISANSGSASSSIKWSPIQADQICTEIFDYIRSCINLVDGSSLTYNSSGNITGTYTNAYTVPPVNNASKINLANGTGQVVPIVIKNPDGNTTRGMGRFPTLRSAALWFIARAANQPPLMCNQDGRPVVYDKNGNIISVFGTYTIASIPGQTFGLAGVTTIDVTPGKTFNTSGSLGPMTYKNGAMVDVVIAGDAYGKVNIMHPWNLPYYNAGSAPGPLFVPQLKSGATVVLADNTGVAAGSQRNLFNIAPVGKQLNTPDLYPLFDFTSPVGNTAGAPPTGVYSSFNSQYKYYTNISVAATNTTPGSQGVIYNYANVNTPLKIIAAPLPPFTTALFPSVLTTFKYFVAANNASAVNYTHQGLPFLSVQDPVTGAFTLKNSVYWDTASDTSQTITSLQSGSPSSTTIIALLPFHSTRLEMAYVPDLVNVAAGAVGLKPKIALQVSGLDGPSGYKINGNTFTLNSSTLNFKASSFDTQNYVLYDLGIQLAMNPDSGGVIPFSTKNSGSGIVVSGETFPFVGNQDVVNSIIGPSGDTVQTVAVNFPNATFPTPKLNSVYFNWGFGVYNPPVNGLNLYVKEMLSFTNSKGTAYSPDEQQLCMFAPELGLGESYGDPSYPWFAGGLNGITADTIQSVDLIYGDPRITSVLTNVPSSMFAANQAYGNSTKITVTNSTATGTWPTYLRNAHSLRAGSLPLGGALYGTLLATNSGTQWTNDFQYPPLAEGNAGAGNGYPSLIGPINTQPLSASLNSFLHYGMKGGYGGYAGPPATGGYGNFFSRNNVRTASPPGYQSINDGHCSLPYTGADCDFTSTANGSFYAMWTNGGDFDNGFAWFGDGPFIGKVDEGFGAFNGYNNVGNNPYYSSVSSVAGASMFSANRMVPSPVIFGSLPVFDTQWDPTSGTKALSTLQNNSWHTLQFSPNPNALTNTMRDTRSTLAGYNEAGGRITNAIPPDHLLLDFFQMPVVSPYPISDPFSTAGKVNMNYQIAPFSYIQRTSAIRGVLKPVMITAVDDQWSLDYKIRSTNSISDNGSQIYQDATPNHAAIGAPKYDSFGSNSGQFYFHYPINASNTLTQFDARFATNDLFHSPSEICSLWLYPSAQPKGNGEEVSPLSTDANGVAWTWTTTDNTSIKNWWYANAGTTRKALTGDNIRERPYNYLYPRLTTKSNTYQIHYRVQALKQTRTAHSSDWSTWIDPSAGGVSDKILGEQRGSAVIERFIDPSDPSIPDFTANISSTSITGPTLDQFYRFRVFNAKQFTP